MRAVGIDLDGDVAPHFRAHRAHGVDVVTVLDLQLQARVTEVDVRGRVGNECLDAVVPADRDTGVDPRPGAPEMRRERDSLRPQLRVEHGGRQRGLRRVMPPHGFMTGVREELGHEVLAQHGTRGIERVGRVRRGGLGADLAPPVAVVGDDAHQQRNLVRGDAARGAERPVQRQPDATELDGADG